MRHALLLALSLLTGCATVNVTPYRELSFPPTSEVDVLREEPDQEHIILAEMWVPANDTNGVLKMRQKAMEIGADALVLLGSRNAGAIAIPLDDSGGGAIALPLDRLYALAVRFGGR